jgi:NitT/TauT family transport system substrate-binding protein
MPAPDAIQAFVLRKGAEDVLHNAHALDANIVALPHPQALAALLNNQVAMHFASPPFEFEEADKGAHPVWSSKQAFGDTTFTCTTMTENFYNSYPDFAAKFLEYMQRADKLINTDPAAAAKYIAEAEGKPQLAAQYKDWLTRKGIAYTVVPSGFIKYATFMKKIGTIDKVPASIKDLELPPAQRLGGS